MRQYPLHLERLETRVYPGNTLDIVGWSFLGSSLAFWTWDRLTTPLEQGRLIDGDVQSLRLVAPSSDALFEAAPSTGASSPFQEFHAFSEGAFSAFDSSSSAIQRAQSSSPPSSPPILGEVPLANPFADPLVNDWSVGLAPRAPAIHPSQPLDAEAGASPWATADASATPAGNPPALAPATIPSASGSTAAANLAEAELTAVLSAPPAAPPAATSTGPDAATLQNLEANGITLAGSDNGSRGNSGGRTDSGSDPGTQSRADGFARTPLRFEANLGQREAAVQFHTRAKGYDVFLTSTEMVLALTDPHYSPPRGRSATTVPPDVFVVRMALVGANPAAQLVGLNQLRETTNFLRRDDATQWLTNVPNYSQVSYRGVYPGIDALYYGANGQLEYDFVVNPGADPNRIHLAFTGPQTVAVDTNGNLVLGTTFGNVLEHAPVMYQVVNGVHRPVSGRYVVQDATHVGFQIGRYNPTLPLVIDPFLSYSAILSGALTQDGRAIAVDADGNAYVTGTTSSYNFPHTSGVVQGSLLGQNNAYVTKFDPTGSMVFSTFLGGNNYDYGNAIAVDGSSNIYVAGTTNSTSFPTFAPYQPSNNGGYDAFVTKLRGDGRAFIYSTYLGGNNDDQADGIALDNMGDAYVTGSTFSTNFPTLNAAQGTYAGSQADAFVTVLNPAGSGLIYSTYLGGSSIWEGTAGQVVAVDSAHNAYVTGFTGTNTFPTYNPIQDTNATGPVLKTSADRTTWVRANKGLVQEAGPLAIDPANPSTVYTAGSDANIYRSDDSGSNWTRVTTSPLTWVPKKLLIDSGTVYATRGSSNQPLVYKSLDRGQTWAPIDNGVSGGGSISFFDLIVDPTTSPHTLYGAAGYVYGIYKYLPTGEWVPSGPGDSVLAIDTSTPVPTLYANTHNTGLVSSTDRGLTWNYVPTFSAAAVHAIAIDPTTSPHALYVAAGVVGGNVVFQSTDGGSTWNPLGNGLAPDDAYVASLALDTTTTPSTIYAGTLVHGVFKKASGSSWTELPSSPAYVHDMAWAPGNSTVFASTTTVRNAFLSKFSSTGAVVYSTYLGGAAGEPTWNSQFGLRSGDSAFGIAVDSAGEAYITGSTYSPNFPTANPRQNFNPPKRDAIASYAFVTKVNAAGTALLDSTFLGGSNPDSGASVALDAAGNVYVAGSTSSPDFPTYNTYQDEVPTGISSPFLTKLDPSATTLLYSTYLWLNAPPVWYYNYELYGNGVAVDPLGNAYVAGTVASAGDAFVILSTSAQIFNNSEPAFGDYGNTQDTGGSATGVYLHDGEFHDREVDLTIPGRGFDFQFVRSYRTGVRFDTPLGRNWDFNYNRRLWVVTGANVSDVQLTFPTARPNDVVRIDGYNRADLYVHNADGSFTDPNGFFTRLVNNGDGTFWERDRDGTVYNYLKPANSDVAVMTSITDRNANTMQFIHLAIVRTGTSTGSNTPPTVLNDSYASWTDNQWVGYSIVITSGPGAGQVKQVVSNTRTQLTVDSAWSPVPDGTSHYALIGLNRGPLAQVIDTLGRSINFQYDSNGHLSAIVDFTGRAVLFNVDSQGNLASVTSPTVTGTPNGNDFPYGKPTSYTYSSGFSDPRRNHQLLTIQAPNEVAAFSAVNRYTVNYDPTPTNPVYARVTSLQLTGTNASGVPAGGTIQYTYPPLPMDHNPAAVSETDVIERNGSAALQQPDTQYQFDAQGDIVRTRKLTTYDPRNNQPAYFQTDNTYNSDYELLTSTLPLSNTIVNQYDSTNTDRYQQGNLLSTTRNPPSGDPTPAIKVSYTYEPIYNQVRTITDPRGTDSTYQPPFGTQSQARYTTTNTFDYQEGETPDANLQPLATQMHSDPTAVANLLAAANVPMGLHDVNGDGVETQTAGNIIRVQKPSVNLVAGSNQATINGSTVQPITSLYAYNSPFGLLIKSIDPEGNVNQNNYYSVASPGSGSYDANGGGYLAQTIVDTTASPTRDNGTNPTPANLSHIYTYNTAGIMVSDQDGRGITTSYAVNQLNQAVQITRAAQVPSGISTDEPLPLTAYSYLERIFYDYNNNVVLRQVEDRGNTSNADGPIPVAALPASFVVQSGTATGGGSNTLMDTTLSFPSGQAQRVVQITSGPGAGQIRTISSTNGTTLTVSVPWTQPGPGAGSAYQILTIKNPTNTTFINTVTQYDLLDGAVQTLQEVANSQYLATSYRYDPNQNRVLTIYPATNASGAVYDERNLLFQSIQGVVTRPAAGLYVSGDPTMFNRPGGAGTVASFFTYNYDKNGNQIESVDAEPNGGTPSTIAGVGDDTVTTYDGFDRPIKVTDPLGNQTLTTYDPASNPVRVIRIGDTVNNSNPTANEHKTLAVTENIPDELNRTIATHQVLFRTPYAVGPTNTPTLTVNTAMAVLTPYLNDSPGGNTGPVPNRNDITVLGRISTFTEYDRDSRTTFVVQPNQATVRTDYDGAGRVVKTIDSALLPGVTRSLSSQATSSTNATLTDSNQTWTANQWQGLIVWITGGTGAGQARPITGNSQNQLTVASQWTTNPDGTSTYSILPGNIVQTAYDGNSNPIEVKQTDVTTVPNVAPETFLTTSFYDSLNRLQTSVDNLGQTDDYRYDSRGNQVAHSDAKGPLTPIRSLNRRALGNNLPISNVNNFGNVAITIYDGLSRPVETDTVLTASGQGDGINAGANADGVIVPTNGSGTSDGNSSGNTLSDGSKTWTANQWVNQTAYITTGRGAGQSRTISSNTATVLTVSPNWTTVPDATSTYAILQVPVPDGSQAGDGLITSYNAWDANSQLLAARDDNGNATAYIYDNQNRTITERKGLYIPGVTFTVTGGDSGAFTRPAIGASTDHTTPNGTDITTTYDRDSNVHTVLNEGDASGARSMLTYTVDALDRQINLGIVNPAGSGFAGTTNQTWQYDGLSRNTLASSNNGLDANMMPLPIVGTKRFYDSLSRPVEEQQQIGTATPTVVSWSYDVAAAGSADSPSTEIYPDSRQVNSRFDSLGRLATCFDNGFQTNAIGTVQYIGGRVAVRSYQNNIRQTYVGQQNGQNADVGYDANQRPVKQVWERFTTGQALGMGTRVIGFGYQFGNGAPAYDRNNNLLVAEKLHDPGNSQVYAYRSDNELTGFQRGTLSIDKTSVQTPTATPGALQSQGWTLDGLGNWTQNTFTNQGSGSATENRTHTDANAVHVVSGSPYGGGSTGTYVTDQDGNVLDDGQRTDQYDALNRLHKVFRKSDGLQVAEYLYDADGRRVESIVTNGGLDHNAPNVTTTFHYSGWDVIQQQDSANNELQYVYGDGTNEAWTLDNRTGGVTVANLNDGVSNDQRLFYLADPQGSTYGLANKGGALREAYQYDPYGRQTVFAATSSGGGVDFTTPATFTIAVGGFSQLNNSLLYAGYRLDRETNQWYVDARYYDAAQGRFLERDPIGYAAGDGNLYRYVSGSPTGATDPSGLEGIKYRQPSYAGNLLSDNEAVLVKIFWEQLSAGRQASLNDWLNSRNLLRADLQGSDFVWKDDRLVTEWQVEGIVNLARTWNDEQRKQEQALAAEYEPSWYDALRLISDAVVGYTDSPLFKAGYFVPGVGWVAAALSIEKSLFNGQPGDAAVEAAAAFIPFRLAKKLLKGGSALVAPALSKWARVSSESLRNAARDVYASVYPRLKDQAARIFNATRKKVLNVHHRIPLEYRYLFSADPNRLSNLVGLHSTVHDAISSLWTSFRLAVPYPTRAQVFDFAIRIDKRYGQYYNTLDRLR
jgi:RHS repeat-associated protein